MGNWIVPPRLEKKIVVLIIILEMFIYVSEEEIFLSTSPSRRAFGEGTPVELSSLASLASFMTTHFLILL